MLDKNSFIDNFSLDEDLTSSNKLPGQPSIHRAYSLQTGSEVLVKKWSRDTSLYDDELYLIWHHEVRQLQRLQTYPGAQDYLLPMSEAGVDNTGYYLVFNSRDRLPFPFHNREGSSGRPILKRKNSSLIWANIKRLVKGLGILHSQGLLHRNIDEWSIFTVNGNIPDYQLGGFEWSLRLRVSSIKTNAIEKFVNKTTPFSFREDWKDLGILSSKLLSIDYTQLKKENNQDKNISSITIEERILLKELIYPSIVDKLDSDSICKRIDEITDTISRGLKTKSSSLFLRYDHSKNSLSLLSAMRDLEPKLLEFYDVTSVVPLTEFITADLSCCELLELKSSKNNNYKYALNGRYLTYVLQEYRNGWGVSSIDHCRSTPFPNKAVNRRVSLENETILVKSPLEISQESIVINDEALHWDQIFAQNTVNIPLSNDARRSFNSFLALHFIEMLQQAANIWLVEVVDIHENEEHGNEIYSVKCITDSPRESLSKALCIESPIIRFEELLEENFDDEDIELKVSEKGILGKKHQSFIWSYLGQINEKNDEKHFKFKGKKFYSIGEQVYLRLSDDAAYDELMQRRTSLLKYIKENPILLESLIEPNLYCSQSHDHLPDLPLNNLDESKQKSFIEILKVLPAYYLQGPPGVGKTHLVTELVKQRFKAEPSSRILVSAQGHDAVNHLMEKICCEIKGIENESDILLVRSNTRRALNEKSIPSLNVQSEKILRNLINSNIFKSAPWSIKNKISDIHARINTASNEATSIDKSLESLLLRSANLVFSTTNSSELERLISYSSAFDWSIIEEAGRATGTELIAPMILSHRRLLIGDPQQLPPFGEDRVISLLKDTSKLRKALEQAESLIDSSLSDLGFDEIIDCLNDNSAATQLARDISNVLLLFNFLHEKTTNNKVALSISGRLSFQHRMHPAISNLISHLFYNDQLLTDEQCISRFNNKENGISFKNLVLPNEPIVIINMPHSQRPEGAHSKEQMPYYHNPAEVIEVINILERIKHIDCGDRKLSVIILTPYKEQASRIRRAIASVRESKLSHLDSFEMFDESVQTIDSFQGKEADIVIASLVRNNGRSYKKGLGIVGDSRRMNVLISRARHKIFIVTSLEFLNSRFLPGKHIQDADDLYFLWNLLKYIETDNKKNNPTIRVIASTRGEN